MRGFLFVATVLCFGAVCGQVRAQTPAPNSVEIDFDARARMLPSASRRQNCTQAPSGPCPVWARVCGSKFMG